MQKKRYKNNKQTGKLKKKAKYFLLYSFHPHSSPQDHIKTISMVNEYKSKYSKQSVIYFFRNEGLSIIKEKLLMLSTINE